MSLRSFYERPKPVPFKTEAEMCSAFMASINPPWRAYPETGGFDILLVHTQGWQIGVEAKLKLNAKVITQVACPADERWWVNAGPDFRAVLVPHECMSSDLAKVCRLLGIAVIGMKNPVNMSDWDKRHHNPYEPGLPLDPGARWHVEREWHDFCPLERIKLPAYVPDVSAGDKSPVTLTEWKVKAIKVAIHLRRQGFVTREDFRRLEISMGRWVEMDWIKHGPERGKYVAGRDMYEHLRGQHPVNFDQIEADYETWRPEPLDPRVADLSARARKALELLQQKKELKVPAQMPKWLADELVAAGFAVFEAFVDGWQGMLKMKETTT